MATTTRSTKRTAARTSTRRSPKQKQAARRNLAKARTRRAAAR